MTKLKKQWILCFALVCLFFNFQNVHSLKIFSKYKYIVPEGKSILLSPESQNPEKKFNWASKNSSVVSIDSKGIAYAKSRGKAVITATDKNGKNMSECIVEVVERDPFQIVYPSLNAVTANENFKISAITYKNAELVKFEIKGEKYSKTFECQIKSNYSDYYIWESNVRLPYNGNYRIKALAKIGKSWRTCNEGSCSISVLEKYDRKKPSLIEKTVSRECADMIAGWEGFRSAVYKDIAGFLTIGYGKRIYPYEIFYNNLSIHAMHNMLLNAIHHGAIPKNVNKFLISNKIKFNQQQFDALVSFSYNLGYGWIYSNSELVKIILDCTKNKKDSFYGIVNSSNGLWVRNEPSNVSGKRLLALRYGERIDILDLKKINKSWYKIKTKDGTCGYCHGDYIDVVKVYSGVKNLNNINKKRFTKEFSAYHHTGGKCNKGLLERRFGELNMFFKGEYKRLYNLKSSNAPYEIPNCAKKLF